MGVLTKLLERRDSLENPASSLSSINWPDSGSRTSAGVSVTEEKALAIAAVWRAIRLCTQDIASMPLLLYTRLPRGKDRATGNPLYRLLHDRPNGEMSSFMYWETVQAHIEMWGNHYSEIEFRNNGTVAGLWPLMPDRTWPERQNGEKIFKTRLPNGRMVELPANRVLHIPGFGYDGMVGKGPIAVARESLGYTMAVRQYGAAYYGNGARVSGVLSHPEVLGPEARKNIRDDWERLHQGLNNAHRIAILEEGVTFTETSFSPEDSQFLDTQRFGVQEVARWFGVPLHMLMDNSMSPASNVEQASLDWVMHGIRPRAIRIEKAVNWDIVPQGQLFAEFLLTALLRGDNASRSQFYRELWNIGAMSQNDIREAENMNTVEGGDTLFVPLNMIPLDQALNPPEPAEPGAPAAPTASQTGRMRAVLERQYRSLITDAVQRGFRRELLAAGEARKKGPAAFRKWRADFHAKHVDYVIRQLLPVLGAYGETAAAVVGLQAEPIEGLARILAAGWAADAEAAYDRALDQPDPAGALDGLLSQWERERAAQMTQDALNGAADHCLDLRLPPVADESRQLPAPGPSGSWGAVDSLCLAVEKLSQMKPAEVHNHVTIPRDTINFNPTVNAIIREINLEADINAPLQVDLHPTIQSAGRREISEISRDGEGRLVRAVVTDVKVKPEV